MTTGEERRTQSLGRVSVQALVEICGRDVGGAPAFEAESIDVSGRGMHVRTAYLPEIGAPLVCRFEGGGNEIVVEGVVAWRSEAERGGEFGIQFTALDSNSVNALGALCGIGGPASSSERPADESPTSSEAGSRVRLHIDGLGSPMKACVRTGSQRELRVASNLEFLKVGRHLEIEDLGNGGRRGAQIGGVDVVIDPETRVPQLVVSLRYDGATEEITPEPSVIDSEDGAASPTLAAAMGGFQAASATTDADDELDDAPMPVDDDIVDAEEEMADEANAMRGKLALFAVDAGVAAKKGGALFAKASAAAAGGVGRAFRQAGAKLGDIKRKKQGDAPRRMTAPPPSEVVSARKLRQQTVSHSGEEEPVIAPPKTRRRAKRIAAASAFAVLLLTVVVIAMKKPSAPPGASADGKAPATVAVAANPAAADVTRVDEQGNPVRAKLSDTPGANATGGVTADVPLFGPTPMATMEPAPLGPAPGDDAEGGDAKSEEDAEKAAASAAVDDETFGGDDDSGGGGAAKKPGDVPPWGHGKLDSPTVYRLRLDKPGSALQGAINPTGFTVMLPGVKVMESTKSIMKADTRIARVKSKNSSSGAEISFQFKDGIPGYKVRLRKDYVEFFISKPSGNSSTSGSGVSSSKKTKKHHSKSKSKSKSAAKPASTKSAETKSKKKGKKKKS